MNETTYKAFDALFETVHRQARRVEELEARITELERRLSERGPEMTRPTIRLAEPQPETAERAS